MILPSQKILIQTKKIVSFSAINQYDFCPFSYKLKYQDKIQKFKGNEYTSFGKSLHKVLEHLVVDKPFVSLEDTNEFFLNAFLKEIRKLPDSEKNSLLEIISKEADPNTKKYKVVSEMIEKGGKLCLEGYTDLFKKFPSFSVVSAEKKEEIEVSVNNIPNWFWKQYIDVVLETSKNEETFHNIIDWKSCSWGWNSRKKSDKMVVYQLALYKHFYSVLNNIPVKNIKTFFGLLKRTAKKEYIEIFEVSTGPQRIKNALTKVEHFINNVEKNVFPKKRLKCEWCDFNKTEYCPSLFKNGK